MDLKRYTFCDLNHACLIIIVQMSQMYVPIFPIPVITFNPQSLKSDSPKFCQKIMYTPHNDNHTSILVNCVYESKYIKNIFFFTASN